jgi:hypothetical protein
MWNKQFADTYWYSTTINDLIFVKKTLMTHSAPASNTEDHHFNTWLENGFLQASEYAKKPKIAIIILIYYNFIFVALSLII